MPKQTILSDLLQLRRRLVDPRLSPNETFFYYSVPAYDASKEPQISSGKQIDSAKFVVDVSDILISKLNPRIKRVWKVDNDQSFRSISSTEFVNISASSPTEREFLFYLLSSDAIYRELRRTAEGTTNSHVRFKPTFLESIILEELPIKASWNRIAEILSTIDEAIEHSEALIAKTQQIKAGLMHDLFTRGVTANGQLRPPREEAPQLYKESPMGWIPREWDLPLLGTMSEIVSGVTLNGEASSGNIEVPYLRVANVQDGYLDLKDVKTIRVNAVQLAKLALRMGDVLMNEGGDFDKLGRGTVWNEQIVPCVHQNHVFRVRPRNEVLRSQFLAYWSQSAFGKKYFILSSKQSTNLASINSSQLNRFPVARPKTLEQKAIEDRLITCDSQISLLQCELGKLRQLKSGLMHDLLTGRMQVPTDPHPNPLPEGEGTRAVTWEVAEDD